MKTKTRLPPKTIRNPIAVAMNKRYGSTSTIMHDRRDERGGDKNEQQEFLQEIEETDDSED